MDPKGTFSKFQNDYLIWCIFWYYCQPCVSSNCKQNHHFAFKLLLSIEKMSLISCPNAGCRKTFKHRQEKKRHLDNKKCTGTPQESFKDNGSIIKKGNMFICLLCNAEIKHINNLSRHKKSCKKRPRQTTFTCNVCSKQFDFKSKFDRHSKIHTRTVFSCKNCFKRFKRKDHLEKHRCSADSTQSAGFGLPTMVDTNQLVPDLDFIPSTPDVASFSDDFVSQTPIEVEPVTDPSFSPAPPESVSAPPSEGCHDDQEVPLFQTPPCHCQNRLAKCCQRKAFDIDSMLETVAQQEKEKIINKALGDNKIHLPKPL